MHLQTLCIMLHVFPICAHLYPSFLLWYVIYEVPICTNYIYIYMKFPFACNIYMKFLFQHNIYICMKFPYLLNACCFSLFGCRSGHPFEHIGKFHSIYLSSLNCILLHSLMQSSIDRVICSGIIHCSNIMCKNDWYFSAQLSTCIGLPGMWAK